MTLEEKDELKFLETLIKTSQENFAEIEMRKLIAPKIGHKSFDSIRRKFNNVQLWLPTATTDSYVDTDKTIHTRGVGLTKEAINYYNHLMNEERKEKLIKKTNNASFVNVIAAIIFGLIVTTIQINTCSRDRRKDNLEERRLDLEIIKQQQQSQHDSLLRILILQNLQKDTSKK